MIQSKSKPKTRKFQQKLLFPISAIILAAVNSFWHALLDYFCLHGLIHFSDNKGYENDAENCGERTDIFLSIFTCTF